MFDKMKSPPISLLLFLFSVIAGWADTLTWDYETGWRAGHVMVIDTSKGTITINDRNNKTTNTVRMKNSENVVAYLRGLLDKVPEKGAGLMCADGEVSKIALRRAGSTKERVIYEVMPPAAIVYNEGYSAQMELKDAERFKANIEGFLIRDTLFQLMREYLPTGESRETNVEQGGAGQPATAPESKPKGKDQPQPESKSAPR